MECLLIGLGISLALVIVTTSSRVSQLELKVATLEQVLKNFDQWRYERVMSLSDDGEIVERRKRK